WSKPQVLCVDVCSLLTIQLSWDCNFPTEIVQTLIVNKRVRILKGRDQKDVSAAEPRHAKSDRRFKLVVVGGGAGGCSIASKFSKKINPKEIAIIEPADTHYYQPMWTLVGGGMKSLEDSARSMGSVLPKGVDWVRDRVIRFSPKTNRVVISNGTEVEYDYLVVALGIQCNYDQVKGLTAALDTPGVCSNYSPLHVNKTYRAIENFKSGNAIFTFPNTPVKCAGAPQKIMYITEDYLRRHNKKKDANLIYYTSLGVLFGIKHYADALWKVVKEREINVNLRHHLIEVIPKEKKAVFQNLDKPEDTKIVEYEMLHVTPPMGAYEVMKEAPDEFTDPSGFLSVNKETLQHVKYPNVFGIGDCINIPTPKTAAAVAGQNGVVAENLLNVMNNKEVTRTYDGYSSCPLVTSDHTCILAEFIYDGKPMETFPFNQAKERRTMFHLKKDIMPAIYWKLMLNGHWNGPAPFRKLMHLGMK
ncbi:unnamed protein product, partial [Allacma fusca]